MRYTKHVPKIVCCILIILLISVCMKVNEGKNRITDEPGNTDKIESAAKAGSDKNIGSEEQNNPLPKAMVDVDSETVERDSEENVVDDVRNTDPENLSDQSDDLQTTENTNNETEKSKTGVHDKHNGKSDDRYDERYEERNDEQGNEYHKEDSSVEKEEAEPERESVEREPDEGEVIREEDGSILLPEVP